MRDTSILVALDELRDIHDRRIDDARSAREHETAARRTAEAVAEQARRDAEAAARKAERDAELERLAAHAAAEREARMRVEMAEASERARLAAELAAERDAAERVLRREAISRQRPRWMIAVAAIAAAATIALAFLVIGQERDAEQARARLAAACNDRDAAKAASWVASNELAALDADLDKLQHRVDAAVDTVTKAREAAERDQAIRALNETRRQVYLKQQERAEAERRKAEKLRKKGIHTENCLGTALGCLDH